MGKKLTKVDFARIFAEVSRLSEKDWDALVSLRASAPWGLPKPAGVPRTRKVKAEAGGEKA